MAGIYIHIPYCKQACTYCDFYFSTNTGSKPQLVQALQRELLLRKDFFDTGTLVQTIYLGGGTPSLLTDTELAMIMDTVRQHYTVSAQPEVTLEANPDDVNAASLQAWKSAGVNRLSIGIQSFRDEDLRFMNRAHTAAEAKACVRLAHDAGFENITIDLIYNIPGMDDAAWEATIAQAVGLVVPHISAYALTVEPRTQLARQVATGQVPAPDDEQFIRNFNTLIDRLKQAGYDHYEISNFAKPGCNSQHNTAYWQGLPYLGIGPSAHSFDGRRTRSWNVRNLHQYADQLAEDTLPTEEVEELTPAQQINERVLTRLRTAQGLLLQQLPSGWLTLMQNVIEALKADGNILLTDRYIRITPAGKPLADGIAAQLMLPDDYDVSLVL